MLKVYVVRVRLLPKLTSEANNFLHLIITDNGQGIPEDQLDKIFLPFYRSTPDLHHQTDGSGIGLSLTRLIVEQHEGTIWVENNHPQGSIFHVLLPVLDIPDNQEPEKYNIDELINKKVKQHKKSTETILFIDDNKEILHYLENQFKDEFRILTSSSAKDSLEILEENLPDIIVSDIMLPEMDGLMFCRLLKKNNRLSHIPVILLSARSFPEQIQEGFKAGADEYITKPFESSFLRARIKNMISTRKQIQKKYQKKLDLESYNIEISENDKDFLEQYKQIIRDNFSNSNLDIEYICQKMGMSRAKFYRKAKTLTKISPAEMIKNMRMEVAAQLLRDTDLSVSEIITKVAFNGSGYFASNFKTIYGMTPKQYRKMNRDKSN